MGVKERLINFATDPLGNKKKLAEAEKALDEVAKTLSTMRGAVADLRRIHEIGPLDAYVKLFEHAKEWCTDQGIQKLIYDFNEVRGHHDAKIALNKLQDLFGELVDPANGWNNTDLYLRPMDDRNVKLTTNLTGSAISQSVHTWKEDSSVLTTFEYAALQVRAPREINTSDVGTMRAVANVAAHAFTQPRVSIITKNIDRVLSRTDAHKPSAQVINLR